VIVNAVGHHPPLPPPSCPPPPPTRPLLLLLLLLLPRLTIFFHPPFLHSSTYSYSYSSSVSSLTTSSTFPSSSSLSSILLRHFVLLVFIILQLFDFASRSSVVKSQRGQPRKASSTTASTKKATNDNPRSIACSLPGKLSNGTYPLEGSQKKAARRHPRQPEPKTKNKFREMFCEPGSRRIREERKFPSCLVTRKWRSHLQVRRAVPSPTKRSETCALRIQDFARVLGFRKLSTAFLCKRHPGPHPLCSMSFTIGICNS
jgi:hypothetical protein